MLAGRYKCTISRDEIYASSLLQSFDISCNQMIAFVPVIQSNPNPIQSESNPIRIIARNDLRSLHAAVRNRIFPNIDSDNGVFRGTPYSELRPSRRHQVGRRCEPVLRNLRSNCDHFGAYHKTSRFWMNVTVCNGHSDAFSRST